MNQYYLNMDPLPNGDHEVITEDCLFIPEKHNRIYLGTFRNYAEALNEAKNTYLLSDGCKFCIPMCHAR